VKVNAVYGSLAQDPHFSQASLHHIALDIGLTLGILDDLRDEMIDKTDEILGKAQEYLGMTMPRADLRRQAFWNKVIDRLVDVINPYCQEPAPGEWKTDKRTIYRLRAWKLCAELLSIYYPQVWRPEDFDLIRSRYSGT
jgi:hypothetical protein